MLCDTNGGTLPPEVEATVKAVIASGIPGDRLGIHCHDDTGTAVACSLAAVTAGLMAGCAGLPSSTASSGPPQVLRVNIFPGGFNWPIWVAQDKGFFAKQGLEIRTINTPNSREQLVGLINGQFEIAMTAIDNLLAYREGQGAVPVDGGGLIAVMGSDNGFLRMGSRTGITSYAQLKGQELSVDALTTGYAFVLLEVLERNGLADLSKPWPMITE